MPKRLNFFAYVFLLGKVYTIYNCIAVGLILALGVTLFTEFTVLTVILTLRARRMPFSGRIQVRLLI